VSSTPDRLHTAIVVVPTTGSALVVSNLVRRPGLASNSVLVSGVIDRALSSKYDGFVKALALDSGSSGESSSPWLVAFDGQIDDGNSWQLPVFVAHVLKSKGYTFVSNPADADLLVWATGALDVGLPDERAKVKVSRANHLVASKLKVTCNRWADWTKSAQRSVIFVPETERGALHLAKLVETTPELKVEPIDHLGEVEAFLSRERTMDAIRVDQVRLQKLREWLGHRMLPAFAVTILAVVTLAANWSWRPLDVPGQSELGQPSLEAPVMPPNRPVPLPQGPTREALAPTLPPTPPRPGDGSILLSPNQHTAPILRVLRPPSGRSCAWVVFNEREHVPSEVVTPTAGRIVLPALACGIEVRAPNEWSLVGARAPTSAMFQNVLRADGARRMVFVDRPRLDFDVEFVLQSQSNPERRVESTFRLESMIGR
jgi:hypothetical protein